MSHPQAMNFTNEPFTDFSLAAPRMAMEKALEEVRARLGATYPLVIGGKSVKVRSTFKSLNPSRPEEIVGVAQEADKACADRSLDAATRAFPSWARVPLGQRVQLLRQMAAALRRRKLEFCAWLIFEVGKNWAEADADVAEAIDFLEYYAELAELPPPVLTSISGEKNEYRYLPLGPVVVISPWNFPLAILVGMASAALVTGNTVILKPSNQAPIMAAKFVELAQEAGLPEGVLSLITAEGTAVAEYLVKDARTHMVAFTGSKTVGLRIHTLAANTVRGQKWIKRVIAEMGGKDAIIVDESADPEAAAQAVIASAFGYQGQKCSACSRLYVHEAVYEDFLARLVERAKKIRQGPADVSDNFMGPLISEMARRKSERYIAMGKRDGRLLYQGPQVDGGYFVPPTLFDRLSRRSRLFHEEVFGPVLAIDKVRSFAEGLECANDTEYGLTGAVFSKDPSHMEEARVHFNCGNLYFNRKCTGALVGGHPFGGFNMSGTDSKAGGPDYLLLFTQAKAISEKLCS